MSEADKNTKQPAAASIPSWQQAAQQQPESQSSETPSSDVTLEQARVFLQDESVRDADTQKKVDFLKSKGLQQEDIDTLLRETAKTTSPASTSPTSERQATAEPLPDKTQEPSPSIPPSSSAPTTTITAIPNTSTSADEAQPDRPPIVTYPEFLTEPLKPPPLITASGLFNSLGIIAGFSTLVYGATKHLVGPMVGSLTDARVDFHQNASKNLSQLVEKLEQAVSEIPPGYDSIGKTVAVASAKKAMSKATAAPPSHDDGDSNYDDPSELFHRDVGVQTSPPPSTPSTPDPYNDNNNNNNNDRRYGKQRTLAQETQHQADRLARIQASMRQLSHDVLQSTEDLAATKTLLNDFSSDLHSLTYPPESYGISSSYLYGTSRNELDDEIKRVKTSIRSVKGVLLSTRSFPSSMR